ncbi:MAG: alcohol dehydrogenase catalytic domain-containing protein [Candidatus Krumholzibacteria bacterium]|nr:alcohol dehydrogenase catalytic domain-containing protein [Candidatus Krumholzibacteria bacterium]
MSDDMWALVFDRSKEDWESSKGLHKVRVAKPVLDDRVSTADADSVIIRVDYTGVCGSDRGIWFRNSFKAMIFDSLDEEGKDCRIVGHELLGEVVEVGSNVEKRFGYKPGEIVAAESHITCGVCRQCRRGNRHVCERAKIIGFTRDGCFAEFIKLPAEVLWRTDAAKIDKIVGSIQEPFGNAVHASTTVDLSGKSVAILGCGPIGLFTILIARALGAAKIIGVEPNKQNARVAEQLGVDEMVYFEPKPDSWKSNPQVVNAVREFGPDGVDVAFEMAGYNSSVNNAISSVDQGGHVILFGIKGGDFTIENFSKVIVRGVSLHSVIGRRVFQTWEMTRKLLESKENQIHDKIFEVILNKGQDTVVHIDDYDPQDFEKRIMNHPKVIIRWS